MADEAAHLRVVTEIVSAVAGDPHEADLVAAHCYRDFTPTIQGRTNSGRETRCLYFRGEYRKIGTVES
jgi:hypothetical protein